MSRQYFSASNLIGPKKHNLPKRALGTPEKKLSAMIQHFNITSKNSTKLIGKNSLLGSDSTEMSKVIVKKSMQALKQSSLVKSTRETIPAASLVLVSANQLRKSNRAYQ